MTIPVIIKRGAIHQRSRIGGLCVTFILLERSAVRAALFKRIDYNPAAVFSSLFPHTPKCGIIRYLAQKRPGKRGERELCNLISPQPSLTPCADDCLGDVMMLEMLCHIRQERIRKKSSLKALYSKNSFWPYEPGSPLKGQLQLKGCANKLRGKVVVCVLLFIVFINSLFFIVLQLCNKFRMWRVQSIAV